jgi:hyperpolarization activated cyclic nucleotide-gated potassium channel 2/hyperpolarization activated cyclic nucleotide-gated potassium channel 4
LPSERKSVKLLKWTKLPKLLRIGRVLKYLKQYIRYANIMGIIFTSMSILHFMTCLWIFLIYDVDTQHEFNGIDVLYFKSMHNVVVQMLGGIASESGDDDSFPYWFSLPCVMFGMLFLLLMIAHVTVVVSNTTSSYSFFRTKVWCLNLYPAC